MGISQSQLRKIHLPLSEDCFDHIESLAIAEHRNDESQAHCSFRCRDHKHKKTKIWPLMIPCWLENATKVRFTAFSMISTDKAV